MTSILSKITSINQKLIDLSKKMEKLELENMDLRQKLHNKKKNIESVGLKYKDEEEANVEIEEIRNSITRFEKEIETCIDIIEEVL